MFRIDRRLVNVSGVKFNKFDESSDNDESAEVGAEGELPDAATSAEKMGYVDPILAAEAAAQAVVDEYLDAAKAETEAKIEKILDDAREQAATIIYQAREDAEEDRKRAWQEGFEEGAEEGRRSFDEKLAAKLQEDDEALKRTLDELYEERERTYSELEEETTNLALEIVRKIINPPEEALGDVFTSLIKNALKQMSTDGKIVIRVGAAEYERFFSSGAATIELDSGITVKASVVRDVSLGDGDCIIDTDDVTVNAGIDSQLQYVKLAFERANQYEPEVK